MDHVKIVTRFQTLPAGTNVLGFNVFEDVLLSFGMVDDFSIDGGLLVDFDSCSFSGTIGEFVAAVNFGEGAFSDQIVFIENARFFCPLDHYSEFSILNENIALVDLKDKKIID